MSDDKSYLIPERLSALQNESHERHIQQVHELIDREFDGKAAVLATFEDHAFVMKVDGEVYKMDLDSTGDGDMEVGGQSKLDESVQPSVNKFEMGKYVCEKMKAMSRSIIEGDTDGVEGVFESIEPYLKANAQDWYFEGIIERIEDLSGDASRSWWTVLSENRDNVDTYAIRHGIDIDGYRLSETDKKAIAESDHTLIRNQTTKTIADAGRLLEDIDRRRSGWDDGRGDGIKDVLERLADDVSTFQELLENIEPYLSYGSEQYQTALFESARQSLEEYASAFAVTTGVYNERQQ